MTIAGHARRCHRTDGAPVSLGRLGRQTRRGVKPRVRTDGLRLSAPEVRPVETDRQRRRREGAGAPRRIGHFFGPACRFLL